LTYHVVFSTDGRRALISERVRAKLHAYLGAAINDSFGRVRRVGGTVDHVHILLELHQSHAIADCLRVVKSNSSVWVHETFPRLRDFAWQEGYGAFSVSASAISRVATYVETQEEHHREMTFRDEFIALLDRHGIEYDEKYLWR
jgi:REP element-mobilizing transposase RayT